MMTQNRFQVILFLSLLFLSYGCASVPKSGKPYGYLSKDRILILEVEPGMRYYIGPEKRQDGDGYTSRPLVKKKEKILEYMHDEDPDTRIRSRSVFRGSCQ
jgi:hypothetical protein